MDSCHTGAKSVKRTEELRLPYVATEVESNDDWLATVIRQALQACTEDVEPSPVTWDLITKRIEASVSSLSRQEEIQVRRCSDG